MQTLLEKIVKDNSQIMEDQEELSNSVARLRRMFTAVAIVIILYGITNLFVIFSLLRRKG